MTKVTIQRDICLNLIVPLTATHDFIPLPPFPPVPPPMPAAPLSLHACAIESPVNAWWPPGAALGSNKFTTSVFHRHMAICLDGHDCGKFIPHLQVAPAPNNMLTLVQIPLSSRKANFSASTVRMNGKPTAAMTAIAWPPTPMTYCSNPINMPLADAPTSHLNSVDVHLTLMDWIAGAVAIVAGMILDYVVFRRAGGTRGFGQNAGKMIAQSRAGTSVIRLIGPDLVGTFLPADKAAWAKWALTQGVGAATGLTRILMTGEGSVTVTLPMGGPFLNVTPQVDFTRSGGVNTTSAGVTGTAGTATGTGTVAHSQGQTTASGSATSRSPAGLGETTVSGQTGKGVTTTETDYGNPFGGFDNSTTTTNPDGTVTRSDSR